MKDTDTLQFESVEVRKTLTNIFDDFIENIEHNGINLTERGWQWHFSRSDSYKSVGYANTDYKIIGIWVWCFDEDCCTLEEAKDTFLHEMAHAFDYEIRGKSDHTKPWKNICLRIGAKPQAKCKIEPPAKVYKWNAICENCNKVVIKSNTRKRNKTNTESQHKECRDKLLESGVDNNEINKRLKLKWIKNF